MAFTIQDTNFSDEPVLGPGIGSGVTAMHYRKDGEMTVM